MPGKKFRYCHSRQGICNVGFSDTFYTIMFNSVANDNVYTIVTTYINIGVNMSVTISLRVEDEIKQEIETLGYKPGEFLKKILIQELKKEQSLRALAWIEKNRLETDGKTAEQLIREDRDSR